MSTPQQRIEADLKAALKAGDKEQLSTLRMLLTEVKNERIRLGAEVDEAGFVGLVRKAIKRREEAAEQFRKGDRAEMAAKEDREAAFLASFLPVGPSEADLRAAISTLVAEQGLVGNAAMGKIIPAMRERFGGAVDNSLVSRIAREVLAGG